MSYLKNKNKKSRKKLRSEEERQVANKIRNGTFPRYFFTKTDIGESFLQRDKKGYLTWKIESAYKALTDKHDNKS